MRLRRRSGTIAAAFCLLLVACDGAQTVPPPTRTTDSRSLDAGTMSEASTPQRVYVANLGTNTVANSVTVYTPDSTLLRQTIVQGIAQPVSLVLDSTGNLYVANLSGASVTVYAPEKTTVLRTILVPRAPDGSQAFPRALAFDGSGNLYVADASNDVIYEYAPGGATPVATITQELSGPVAMVFDSSGNLYADNAGNGSITEYAAGTHALTKTIDGKESLGPVAIAFDTSGNLYVANQAGNSVSVYAPGDVTPAYTIKNTVLKNPQALIFDPSGDLYVGGDSLTEYAPGAIYAKRTLATGILAYALGFDAAGRLYVPNYDASSVAIYSRAGALLNTITAGVASPIAIAITP